MRSHHVCSRGLALVLLATGLLIGGSCPVALGVTQPTFSRTDHVVGAVPDNPTVADVDGDGHLDVVVPMPDNVSIMYGDGTGGFRRIANYRVGVGLNSVAVSDLDRDGRRDIAIADEAGNAIHILMADRSGGFTVARKYSSPGAPATIRIADLNRDRIPDLVVTHWGTGTVGVLRGLGSGDFAPETLADIGGAPHHDLRDLNRDGQTDIVSANYSDNTVSVALGNGQGGFGSVATYAAGNGPHCVAFGDFNNDGIPDVATADIIGATVSVLLGRGGGSLGAARQWEVSSYPVGVTVCDLNGDGNDDIAVSCSKGMQTLSVLLGDGTGSFERASDIAVGPSPWGIASGDLDWNGVPDLVTANMDSNTVSVLLNKTIVPTARFTRLSGIDRVETAIAVSRQAFPDRAQAVVIVNAYNFPDAIAAAPLAKAYGAPVLVSGVNALTPSLLTQLKALAPERVFIIGGTGVIASPVEQALRRLPTAPAVTRLGGATRYDTAVLVAEALKGKVGTIERVVLVPGRDFHDASAVAPLAASQGWPILLCNGPSLPSATSSEINRLRPSSTLIVADTAEIPPTVAGRVPSPTRIGYSDHYTNAGSILDFAASMGVRIDHVALTVGSDFPDALASGAYLGRERGLLLFTWTNALPAAVSRRLEANKGTIRYVDVIGGPAAVSDSVADQARRALR